MERTLKNVVTATTNSPPHSDCGSSSCSPITPNSSSSTTSSLPQYSEDLRRLTTQQQQQPPTALELLSRQGSGSSSTKTCEVDLGDEERDTFSPVSSNSSPCDVDCNGTNVIATTTIPTNDAVYNGAGSSNIIVASSTTLVDNKNLNKAQQAVITTAAAATTTATIASSSPTTSNFKTKTSQNQNNTNTTNGNLQHSTTKEEKQRQNEEIVIMETSSISSETGSWESVYPHAVTATSTTAATTSTTANPQEKSNLTDINCSPFKLDETYLRERTYSTGAAVTADTSSLFTGGSTSSLLRENALVSGFPGTSACFIDASSLRDEDEVLSFPSLEGHQSNDEGHEAEEEEEEENVIINDDDNDDDDKLIKTTTATTITTDLIEDDSPTKKLETFHKSFAKCKVKSKELPLNDIQASNSSSNSDEIDSPEKNLSIASPASANNLSDEEKLWKRELNSRTKIQEKDPTTGQQLSMHDDITEASVSLAGELDSSDSSDVVKLRREQERKQVGANVTSAGVTNAVNIVSGGNSGNSYVFHHNMQQFTVHPLGVSPKFPVHCAPAAQHVHSDQSYTTDYSSSSPAPSLVWSEHENRPSTGGSVPYEHSIGNQQKSCLMPETPHNSIVHIDAGGSSNASSIHRDYTLSSSFTYQRDSGAYCSDATDSPIPMPRTPKRSKFDEANPIVSGGASIKDFNIKQCESPPIKRRTETCPIVSGGFVSLDFEQTQPIEDDAEIAQEEEEVELRAKPKTRKPIPGIASWVVDMSDCRPERRKSTSSTSSLDILSAGNGVELRQQRERSDSTSSHKSGCGFYVSLSDMDKKPNETNTEIGNSPMSKSFSTPKSTGFFVNLSKSEYAPQPNNDEVIDEQSESRKNMFSMFIDIGGEKDKKLTSKKEPLNLATRLSGSLTSAQQRRTEDIMKSSASSTETLMSRSANLKMTTETEEPTRDNILECKSLDYNRCNLEQPITVAAIRRISQQQRAQNDATKRHSWGQSRNETGITNDCKRSISFTVNGGELKDGCNGSGSGLMSIIDKIPLIAKASSHSIDSSLSPYDEYTGSKSELSTCSNNSARNSMSGGERDDDIIIHNIASSHSNAAIRIKKRRRDVQINETFDKSSLASITDGVLSKDLSPASTTDTDDLTFQQDEELAIREALQNQHEPHASSNHPQPNTQILSTSNRSSAIIMETIIEAKETASPKKSVTGHTLESLHATIEKQKMLLETVNEHGEVINEKANFVKLSDMDKPLKLELHSPESLMSKSVGNHRQINRLFRDETSSKGRPHSWTMTRSTGNNFLNITNSVDNLRSLSRLFPHFSKEFSNSLPNDMILDQMDYIQTDISADSSLASSFSRSGMDESSISCRQPRRLGEDLLKMFLQEIATDMIVEVHGRRIKAHKCILRSRCQYFAAMLAGNGAQSVVSLQGYSYSAVHFALCHIYSGASHPPDGISLMELAALADLLGLEGLKEVTAHALKTNYCHNFHKPCSGCIDGILQVLPVALNHALDDLYRKCLRWTCRHYLKVWPTRQFAQLPPDILGRCRQQIVAYMTPETVLDTVLDCDNLLRQLATYRWGGICENLVRDILDSAYLYIADHFASLIASDAFLSLGHDRSCHIPHLEGVLLRTASSLTPDQACRSYQRVTRLNTVLQAKILQMPANLGELAKELQGLQEEDLDWDTEYIRLVSAILSAVEQCLIRQCSRAMRVTAWQRMDLDLRKKIQTLARLTEPIDLKRGSKPVSKAFSFGGSTRNQDLYQVKLAIQAHSKRAQAQDTQLYKATQTHDGGNIQTAERGVQANNDLREGTGKIFKSNSRAYVPQIAHQHKSSSNSQSATVSERNSLNAQKRTQQSDHGINKQQQKSNGEVKSESIAIKQPQPTKQQPLRLNDVRPRYLEPRKSRTTTATSGPVRSATSSSIPATTTGGLTATYGKTRQISSSDSSRNSSPAAIRKNNATLSAVKIGTKSTNMSLDSLASPSRRGRSSMTNIVSKRATRGKSTDNDRYSDAGIDSLAESMKSSVITNKTISQESLSYTAKLSRSNPHLMATTNKNQIEKSLKSKTIGNHTKPAGITLTAKHLVHPHHHIASTGSSPSSVTTTKSAASRISSVSSTQSTRDMYKHRSISVPATNAQQDLSVNNTTAGQSSQRRSFLSAKSREILAKRAEKNKQLQLELEKQQQKQQQQASNSGDEKKNFQQSGPLRSASHTAVPSIMNRQAIPLPSNIPTRRPNTLQLKKTNGICNSKTLAINNHNNNSNTSNSNSNKHHQKKVHNLNNGNEPLPPPSALTGVKGVNVKQNLELILIDNSANEIDTKKQKQHLSNTITPPIAQQTIPMPPLRIESKLERSSTFCKENSDLDLSELQIIE